MRRSQTARSRRERDVRAQAGRGAASPNHTVYIGTVANPKYCALPSKITKMIVWISNYRRRKSGISWGGGGGGRLCGTGQYITSKIAATLSHIYIDHFHNLHLYAYYVAQVCL